jgi:protein TonB
MERSRRRLFETAFQRRRASRTVSLPLSIGLHVLLLGAIIIVPLLASQEPPKVTGTTFIPTVPVIPVPHPPPRGPGNATNMIRNTANDVRPTSTDLVVPTKISDIVPEIDPGDLMDYGDPNGVPHGIDGVGSYIPIFRNVVNNSQEAQAVHQVGGIIKPPERIHYVAPVYSQLALDAKIQGSVKLKCTIDEMGRVVGMQVVKSLPLLDESALDAVSQWRYKPTLLNGVPVAVSMEVTVDFRIR